MRGSLALLERPFRGTISFRILDKFTSPRWFSLVRNFLGKVHRHLRFCHVMIHQITFFVILDGRPRSFRLLIKNLFGTMSPRFVESCILIESYISTSFCLLETRDVYPEGFRCLTVANKYPFSSRRFQLRPFSLGTCTNTGQPNIRRWLTSGISLENISSDVLFPSTL